MKQWLTYSLLGAGAIMVMCAITSAIDSANVALDAQRDYNARPVWADARMRSPREYAKDHDLWLRFDVATLAMEKRRAELRIEIRDLEAKLKE